MSDPCVIEIETPSAADLQTASDVLDQIDTIGQDIKNLKSAIEKSFLTLGRLLEEVHRKRHWISSGHRNFGAFLASLNERFGISHTQAYDCLSIVQKVVPLLSENEPGEFGISRCKELLKVVNASVPLTSELLETARSGRVEDLKNSVDLAVYGETRENGKYRRLGYFGTDEEFEFITSTFDLAARIEPILSSEMNELARTKHILLRLCGEFWAEHGAKTEDSPFA